jgi:hypothetical protein
LEQLGVRALEIGSRKAAKGRRRVEKGSRVGAFFKESDPMNPMNPMNHMNRVRPPRRLLLFGADP